MNFCETLFGESVFFHERNAADKNFRLRPVVKFYVRGHIYLFSDFIILNCRCCHRVLDISGAANYFWNFSNNKIKQDINPLIGILLITSFFQGNCENYTTSISFGDRIINFIAKLIIFSFHFETIDCNGSSR